MAKRTPKKKAPVFQLKLTLDGVERAIWRRVLVPADVRLDRLHLIIQEAMGWEGAHLHQFEVGGRAFGDPRMDESAEDELADERRFKLDQIAGPGTELHYWYDFGDDWWHTIEVEAVLEPDERWALPLCIGGDRACPPEDCGGVYGYQELLDALRDPDHERHDEVLHSVGGFFDPEGFDANRVNRQLRGLAARS